MSHPLHAGLRAVAAGPSVRAFSNRDASPTLLIIDDEPLVGRMLAHAAEECGYAATLSGNAASFRQRYEAEPPEIVLLDLSLPGGDGIELLRFLAEKKSQSLILICSGFDRRVVEAAERLGEALGLRMGGWLAKPVLVDELGEAIETARLAHAATAGGARDGARICL